MEAAAAFVALAAAAGGPDAKEDTEPAADPSDIRLVVDGSGVLMDVEQARQRVREMPEGDDDDMRMKKGARLRLRLSSDPTREDDASCMSHINTER